MSAPLNAKAKDAVDRVTDYLHSCNIRVPSFDFTTTWEERIGGSHVTSEGKVIQFNMGRYPTDFLRNWFAMHEMGHVLWSCHQPLRSKAFREAFGAPEPRNYNAIHLSESWKTPASFKLSWHPGPHRPKGEPSWYGARAGGEERFCELIGLMYAHGDFSKEPPSDLADLWDTCWTHGLSRMT